MNSVNLAGVNPSQVAYTSKGNPYVKSDKGKTVGTTAGLTLGLASVGTSEIIAKKTGRMGYVSALKNLVKWVKEGGNAGIMTEVFSPKLAKMINFCNKNKILRAGFAGAAIAAPFVILAGAGRLLGAAYDKIVDIGNKRKANNYANM